ncbi:PH domain-containing protein [Demequina aurantiaca]|uniref:PH domain-containing protein n=1 Tax=Demequina aurantiaca TaxID=676200 RepID=UPI003D3436B6
MDFENATFVKLKQVVSPESDAILEEMLLEGESILMSFRGSRDKVVFTSKRVIALNVQGMLGKKKSLTSLPYTKIQSFSVETAGTFDRDAEMELWFSGLGKVKFAFAGDVDVAYLSKLIGHYVLQ